MVDTIHLHEILARDGAAQKVDGGTLPFGHSAPFVKPNRMDIMRAIIKVHILTGTYLLQ